MRNELLVQRANDLRDVGLRVLSILTGEKSGSPSLLPTPSSVSLPTTSGERFTKADELRDEKSPRIAHDCGVDEAKMRFFGDGVAVVYGSEHAVGKDKSHLNAKVCQVWTDTWLKRDRTWQIIASHDTRITIVSGA
jgi:hypothetical protein